MKHLLDVFTDSLERCQKMIYGDRWGLAAENSFMSSTPDGMMCLASSVGSISSVSTIQGKCWLNFTQAKVQRDELAELMLGLGFSIDYCHVQSCTVRQH